ncbi:hypothetical protein FRC02_007745 [Tulasnella sp. 418]|nr:hypothetical protein FRC02_007745 [Tulasnella sp. 418]
MKSFIPLALSPSHPFWAAEELPYPKDSVPKVFSSPLPGHIYSHLGGHTFALSSGQACHYPLRAGAEKYGKLAYSTAFGYAVPTGTLLLDQHAPDNTIALSEDGGVVWKVRRECEQDCLETVDGVSWLRAVWKPWKDVEVETFLVPPQEDSPLWHLRIHRLRTGRDLVSSDAGFSNYGQRKDGRILDVLDGSALSTGTEENFEGRVISAGDPSSFAASAGGVVGVLDLTPTVLPNSGSPRKAEVIPLDANTNIVFSRSTMPTLMGAHGGDGTKDVWLVTAIFGIPSRVGEDGVPKVKWVEEWNKRPIVPAPLLKLMK